MGKVLVEESSLQNIANAIRAKNNKTDKYLPGQMANAISDIKATITETEGDLQIVSQDKWSFKLVQSDNQTITFTPVAKLIHNISNKYSSVLDTNVKIEPNTGYIPGTVRKSADTGTKIYTITATPAEGIAGMIENGYAKVYEDDAYFYSDEKYTTKLHSLSGKILVAGMKGTKISSTSNLIYRNSKITDFKNTFVTNAGDDFLHDCSSLVSVDLPNLTNAGDDFLYGCSSLVSVDLPNLTNVGPCFLYDCSSLVSVDLPNLTSAGPHFLHNCSSLVSVDLSNLTSAEYDFLYGCSSLVSVFLRSSVVCKITDQDFPSKCSIYVPASIIDSYKTANVWIDIAERIKTLESIALTKISISGPNKINIFYNNNATKNYSINYNDGLFTDPKQKDITWSIVGNATITQNGIVTLNNAKVGDTITITATSVYDNSISASLAVSIISTDKEMNIDLNNGQYVDSGTQVDGHTVYKSDAGSYHINSGKSTCTINVMGYSSVTVYARSYAESSYDYLEVGPLDGTVARNASSNVLSTKGNQSSTTYLSHTFTIEDKEQHTFQVLYSKDSSGDNNDDRGYFYIVAE